MPRPTRIEYEGAFYHVMNRGRGRKPIFHDETYFGAFLATLKESHDRFDAQLHAYCLMGNHYHLLIETPKANLGRIMRHVNGVYTQRYNRLRKTDGPLFRGRYKAILVDEDAYLLQLSRYIHRNPVEMKRPLVNQLCDYKWSSFPAYINEAVAPEWLFREKTYQMLGKKQKYVGYQNYISEGVDEDILRFYNRGNMAAVLGDRGFRESARDEVNGVDMDRLRSALQDRPDINSIIKICADVLSVDEQSIRSKPVGRREPNSARAFAMWACQHYGGLALKDIAAAFELGHPGSASFSINKIKKEVGENRWKESLVKLELHIYIIK